MPNVIVVIGSGSIGLAIARRIGAGKALFLADIDPKGALTAAESLSDAGFDARPVTVDVTSRESVAELARSVVECGNITGVDFFYFFPSVGMHLQDTVYP